MATLEVEGGRIWHATLGAGPGLPVVLVHGGPGASHRQFDALAPRLAPHRPVVLYDQLGCGDSERPDDPALWRLERFVGELASLVRALGLRRYHLLGHSWGGMLALAFASSGLAPEPTSLVLSGPCLDAKGWEEDQEALLDAMPPAARDAIRHHEAAGTVQEAAYVRAAWAFSLRHWCRDEALARALLAQGGFNRAQYLAMWGPSEWRPTGTLRDVDLTPLLPRTRVPTLFACGEHDMARPDRMRAHAQRMPDARVHVLPGCAHLPMLEAPDAYAAAVEAFLRLHDAPDAARPASL